MLTAGFSAGGVCLSPERFKDVSLKCNFDSEFVQDTSSINVTLNGNSFEVLMN